jgi:lipoprotein-anchoring transpeptidase ErfK/SrfK
MSSWLRVLVWAKRKYFCQKTNDRLGHVTNTGYGPQKNTKGREMFRVLAIFALVIGLAGCASKFQLYTGLSVTSIQVHKSDRKLYLLHEDKVLKIYDVALGGNPIGHKRYEGDGKTPEGAYRITHKNPESTYHLSLGISYPNDQDRAYANTLGRSPGGDIFIHGGPISKVNRKDWTAGCIAVTDKEIEEIYAMVPAGTPIYIFK